jgi:hypothetical protein
MGQGKSGGVQVTPREAARVLGRKGGKAGKGKSKARTSEQARKAALARWEKEEKK